MLTAGKTNVPDARVSATEQDIASSSSRPGRIINPAYSLLSRLKLAAGLFIGVAGLGLIVAWWKGAPVYSSEAVVYVSPHFVRNLQEDKEFELQSNSQYREYVQQNARTINRYDIVSDALRNLGSRRWYWQQKTEGDRRATERLQQALEIRPIPDTYQIVVSLENKRRDGLADVVNAVVETYLKRAKDEEFYDSDKRLETLGDDRARLQREIDEKQDRRTQLAQELGVSTFSESFPNPYDRLVTTGREALAEATRHRIEAEAQFTVVDPNATESSRRALEAFARDFASKDAGFTSIQTSLNQRRSDLLAKTSGLAQDHPGRRAAAREIEEIERERKRVFDGLVAWYSSILVDQRRADSTRNQHIEADLKAELERESSKASWFTSKYQQAIALGLDIERTRKRLDAIDDRINFLSLETRAPGFVRMFSRARPPEVPSRAGRKKLFAMFLAGALALGLLAPTAIDYFDPYIRTARDAHRVLGFAPLAWLPRHGAGAEFEHEQVLRLANRLDQDRLKTGSKIFVFTSVLPGGGVTSVVADTARCLAALGVPALAVEANAYRSDRRYSGAHEGLSVVLKGNRDLADVIAPADDDLPDRISVGDTGSARNLPDIHRLMSILRDSAEAYSIVLLDLPPVVLSVDAEYLARAADVVVLVCEADAARAADLRRAATALERLDPRAVSCIVNKVSLNGIDSAPRRIFNEYMGRPAPLLPAWLAPWLWR